MPQLIQHRGDLHWQDRFQIDLSLIEMASNGLELDDTMQEEVRISLILGLREVNDVL